MKSKLVRNLTFSTSQTSKTSFQKEQLLTTDLIYLINTFPSKTFFSIKHYYSTLKSDKNNTNYLLIENIKAIFSKQCEKMVVANICLLTVK